MKYLFLLSLLISFDAWSTCGKLCDYEWWNSKPSPEDLKDALEGEIDLNTADSIGIYPIHFSALFGSLEHVKTLLKSGADPLVRVNNSKLGNIHGKTSLHYVMRDNIIDKASIFISAGVDVNAVNGEGETALHSAPYTKSTAYVKFLLDMKANVNVRDKDGCSPLYNSVHSTPEIVKLLIDRGANVSIVTTWGSTPLHFAVREEVIFKSDPEIIKILIKSGADVNAKGHENTTPLHNAVSRGNIEAVKILLKAGANVNARDEHGYTTLHMANDLEKTKLLIKSGAELRVKNSWGERPLHTISRKGTLEQVKFLLTTSAKNDINSQTDSGNTPLIRASMNQTKDVIQALLNAGANVHARNKEGNTPLHGDWFSTISPDTGAVEILLLAGAKVDARNGLGKTPLHKHARDSGNGQVVKLLLKYGANPNAKDDSGKTPWDYIQENEMLKHTNAYWELNDARFN